MGNRLPQIAPSNGQQENPDGSFFCVFRANSSLLLLHYERGHWAIGDIFCVCGVIILLQLAHQGAFCRFQLFPLFFFLAISLVRFDFSLAHLLSHLWLPHSFYSCCRLSAGHTHTHTSCNVWVVWMANNSELFFFGRKISPCLKSTFGKGTWTRPTSLTESIAYWLEIGSPIIIQSTHDSPIFDIIVALAAWSAADAQIGFHKPSKAGGEAATRSTSNRDRERKGRGRQSICGGGGPTGELITSSLIGGGGWKRMRLRTVNSVLVCLTVPKCAKSASEVGHSLSPSPFLSLCVLINLKIFPLHSLWLPRQQQQQLTLSSSTNYLAVLTHLRRRRRQQKEMTTIARWYLPIGNWLALSRHRLIICQQQQQQHQQRQMRSFLSPSFSFECHFGVRPVAVFLAQSRLVRLVFVSSELT